MFSLFSVEAKALDLKLGLNFPPNEISLWYLWKCTVMLLIKQSRICHVTQILSPKSSLQSVKINIAPTYGYICKLKVTN